MVLYSWQYDDPVRPRPPEIATVEAFLNTVDRHTFGEHADKPDERRDLIADPGGLRRWLVAHDLLAPNARVTKSDVADVRVLRDGLRAWLRADGDSTGPDPERCQRLMATLRLRPQLGDRTATLAPAHSGVRAALERLAADVAIASATGTLRRLKICSADDCQFVYYDHSRSRTARWCSMETCGNRVKTRRYRKRHSVG